MALIIQRAVIPPVDVIFKQRYPGFPIRSASIGKCDRIALNNLKNDPTSYIAFQIPLGAEKIDPANKSPKDRHYVYLKVRFLQEANCKMGRKQVTLPAETILTVKIYIPDAMARLNLSQFDLYEKCKKGILAKDIDFLLRKKAICLLPICSWNLELAYKIAKQFDNVVFDPDKLASSISQNMQRIDASISDIFHILYPSDPSNKKRFSYAICRTMQRCSQENLLEGMTIASELVKNISFNKFNPLRPFDKNVFFLVENLNVEIQKAIKIAILLENLGHKTTISLDNVQELKINNKMTKFLAPLQVPLRKKIHGKAVHSGIDIDKEQVVAYSIIKGSEEEVRKLKIEYSHLQIIQPNPQTSSPNLKNRRATGLPRPISLSPKKYHPKADIYSQIMIVENWEKTLNDIIDQNKLSLEKKIETLKILLRALEKIHETTALVDIIPENIGILKNGDPIFHDFFLAEKIQYASTPENACPKASKDIWDFAICMYFLFKDNLSPEFKKPIAKHYQDLNYIDKTPEIVPNILKGWIKEPKLNNTLISRVELYLWASLQVDPSMRLNARQLLSLFEPQVYRKVRGSCCARFSAWFCKQKPLYRRIVENIG